MCQILLNTTITQTVKYKQIVPNNPKVLMVWQVFLFLILNLLNECRDYTCPSKKCFPIQQQNVSHLIPNVWGFFPHTNQPSTSLEIVEYPTLPIQIKIDFTS